MIPHIFHQVWLGPRPLPPKEKEWMESWRHFHPHWDFKLWTDANIDELELPLNCIEAINGANWPRDDLAPCYACKSDVVRYVALLRYGGIYGDTDLECFKNIENLFTDPQIFIGLQPHAANRITNTFIGAEKKCKIISNMIKGISGAAIPMKYGPCYINHHLYNFLDTPTSERVSDLQSDTVRILSPSFSLPSSSARSVAGVICPMTRVT